jgi:hypothetical protein
MIATRAFVNLSVNFGTEMFQCLIDRPAGAEQIERIK